jgi:hypothetical protein
MLDHSLEQSFLCGVVVKQPAFANAGSGCHRIQSQLPAALFDDDLAGCGD